MIVYATSELFLEQPERASAAANKAMFARQAMRRRDRAQWTKLREIMGTSLFEATAGGAGQLP